MVNAIAKLHNFCIDEVDSVSSDDEIGDLLQEDVVHIEGNDGGFVSMVANTTVNEPDPISATIALASTANICDGSNLGLVAAATGGAP